ncbi:hypothetical protein GRAQ_01936 [Rahnella aquatilis CIP 78.65 = ATCC 33071]|uniref:Uncharacterized protein n=1 Tax=Rahnella aquatilis (strain ATCC 33071 / DSM 4594 / JCM 1683 / NBRC 105701 / NCIMB 13365 / CIP 78.65) TaxID=745277 RepID=H2ITE0_RAHAC|nr:hypothetical protein [Rahnella aquatilis]AEX52724.1 hypothetical protein Rahaq2_2895 [Rahnella aquatilis CIP 78.65 = ATCC 33071]KFD05277.1 hypothetical protein GRAQ_01936 [Rahnella aquatilis CIP 78.65 = ATCC 33071]
MLPNRIFMPKDNHIAMNNLKIKIHIYSIPARNTTHVTPSQEGEEMEIKLSAIVLNVMVKAFDSHLQPDK